MSKPRNKINKVFISLVVVFSAVATTIMLFYNYQQKLESYNTLIDLMEYQNEEMDKNIKLFNEIKIVDEMTWREFMSYERYNNINAMKVYAAEEYLGKIDEFINLQIKLISEPKNVKLLNQFGVRQKTEDEIVTHLTNVFKYLEDRIITYNYLVDHANSISETDTNVKKAKIVFRSDIPHADPYYAFGLKK